MSKYRFDPKLNCLESAEAACTYYRKDLPESSSLSDEDCVVLEETTEELYNITEQIKEDTDLSELGNDCITYTPAEENNLKVKEALKKLEEEVCVLKEAQSEKIQSICNLLIEDCDLDIKTLVDSCNIQPSTFGSILQTLIDEIDSLKTRVSALEAA